MALAPAVVACTTFLLGDPTTGVVIGKSYDWHMGQGMVVANKRGVAKRALAIDPRDKPAEWVSRYASITFNQYGRELPNGGMNEAGLVVEVMWLDDTRYEPRDERPAVGELQWIEMQLDLRATAAEVAAAVPEVRIFSDTARVHYLACDRGGECVAVEVVGGAVTATRGVKALTNDTFARSAAYLARQRGAVPPGRGSLERFVRASKAAEGARGDAVAAAWGTLDCVSQGTYSQWNIVYEPARGRVSWRTQASREVKSVSLGDFDGACGTPVVALDIDEARAGDVKGWFTPWGVARNRALVERSLQGMTLPPGAAALLSGYPQTTRCAR